MKISKSRIRQLIKESIVNILTEVDSGSASQMVGPDGEHPDKDYLSGSGEEALNKRGGLIAYGDSYDDLDFEDMLKELTLIPIIDDPATVALCAKNLYDAADAAIKGEDEKAKLELEEAAKYAGFFLVPDVVKVFMRSAKVLAKAGKSGIKLMKGIFESLNFTINKLLDTKKYKAAKNKANILLSRKNTFTYQGFDSSSWASNERARESINAQLSEASDKTTAKFLLSFNAPGKRYNGWFPDSLTESGQLVIKSFDGRTAKLTDEVANEHLMTNNACRILFSTEVLRAKPDAMTLTKDIFSSL